MAKAQPAPETTSRQALHPADEVRSCVHANKDGPRRAAEAWQAQ